MIETRTRIILGAEQILKIARLYPFVNQADPSEEYRSLLFEIGETGVVVVTACCRSATAQYSFQAGDGAFVPGNFLYPFSELVKFARQTSIVIEAETDPSGNCIPQTSFHDDFGSLDTSAVRAGSLSRFRHHPTPANDSLIGSFELGAPEFARAAIRLSSVVNGNDLTQPLQNVCFYPDYGNKLLVAAGVSTEADALGMSTLAVTVGKPLPILVQPDVLVRVVRALPTPAPEGVPVYVLNNGTGAFGLPDCVVTFPLGQGEYVFPDRSDPSRLQSFFEVYQRARPVKESSHEAAITRQPLADALSRRLMDYQKAGHQDAGVMLELTWCRMRLFDVGGDQPFADLGVDYEGPDIALTFRLSKLSRLANCMVFTHFKMRFNDSPMVEFMDIPDTGRVAEFKALMVRTRT